MGNMIPKFFGRLIKRDVTTSDEQVRTYRKAAEQGDAGSQRFLGSYFSLGLDGRQDHAEAAKWYRKAAEQGDAKAQFFLAGCYESGNGVQQNGTEAVKWYQKAAAQGNVEAQCCLGMCYANGDGVSEDVVEAYMWIKLAQEQDEERASKALDLVRSLLTLEQLLETETRYAEFRKLHHSGHQTEKDQRISKIDSEAAISSTAAPAGEQRAKTLGERIAERLGDTADEAQVKSIADKIRKEFEEKGAAALARIKTRRANVQKF